MRRLSSLLLGVLLLGSVELAFGVQQSTHVSWTINGCWITLEVHGEVNLGTVSGPWNAGDYIEDTDGNRIEIKTNCSSWVLTLSSRDWAPPSGYPYPGDGLADFYTRVVKDGGNHSIDDGWKVPNNGVGDIATGGRGHHWFYMGYRYVLDYDDIPGNYTVTLTYTVTAR